MPTLTLARRRLPMEAATRREFVAMLAAAGLLAACGDDSSGTSPTTTTPGFPRVVGRGWAETTVPAKPTRIVATADRDQLDVLLAMGISPVLYGYSGDYEVAAPWIDPTAVAGLARATMPGAFEPNLELIAAARPDLIVDAWSEEAAHATLSAIAPTVQIKLDNTDSWEDAQRLAGQAAGEEGAAEDAISTTQGVLATQADRLSSVADLAVAIAFVDGDELVMIPATEIGGRVFTQLGLQVVAPPNGTSGRFSVEQIGELLGPADLIVSFDDGGLDDQESNALFRSLPAVTGGRYVTLPPDLATACYQESSLSLRWAAAPLADAILTGANGQGRQLG